MPRHTFAPSVGWAAALAAAVAVLALAATPPFVGAGAGAMIHLAFDPLCHQIAERSPQIDGAAFALCHRCTGILVGLVLGLLATPALPGRLLARSATWRPGLVLLLSGVPAAIDWTLGATGVWSNTPVSRLLTGALFGLAAGWILALALLERTPALPSSPNLLAS